MINWQWYLQISNELQRMCFQIYTYLQTTCVDEGHKEVMAMALAEKPFILCHNRFLLPSQLSFSFTHNCSPYIFSVSEMLKRNFTELLKVSAGDLLLSRHVGMFIMLISHVGLFIMLIIHEVLFITLIC